MNITSSQNGTHTANGEEQRKGFTNLNTCPIARKIKELEMLHVLHTSVLSTQHKALFTSTASICRVLWI